MLLTSIIDITKLTVADKRMMFRLYDAYYQSARQDVFERDLASKDWVVLLRDSDDIVRGFSTIAVYRDRYRDEEIAVIYSGDTIIERSFWGQNQFAKAWLTFAGQVKAEVGGAKLYWLLIAKGHRTYRYLSLFSKEYFPTFQRETPAQYQSLMHHLAGSRFGSAYSPDTGLVLFPEPRSFLNEELAEVPAKDGNRAEVQFFLQQNPRYFEGDELLCLCELTPEKLTRVARQWFQQGQEASKRQSTESLTVAMLSPVDGTGCYRQAL